MDEGTHTSPKGKPPPNNATYARSRAIVTAFAARLGPAHEEQTGGRRDVQGTREPTNHIILPS